MNNNDNVVFFLKKLIVDIENKNIEDKNMEIIGEFMMKYLYIQEDKTCNNEDDEEDFTKFLFLGWYFYNQIKISDDITKN